MTTELLTVPETAKRLRISRDYCYRLVESGQIAATRIGRKVFVTEKSIEEFINRKTAKSRSSRKGAAA